MRIVASRAWIPPSRRHRVRSGIRSTRTTWLPTSSACATA